MTESSASAPRFGAQRHGAVAVGGDGASPLTAAAAAAVGSSRDVERRAMPPAQTRRAVDVRYADGYDGGAGYHVGDDSPAASAPQSQSSAAATAGGGGIGGANASRRTGYAFNDYGGGDDPYNGGRPTTTIPRHHALSGDGVGWSRDAGPSHNASGTGSSSSPSQPQPRREAPPPQPPQRQAQPRPVATPTIPSTDDSALGLRIGRDDDGGRYGSDLYHNAQHPAPPASSRSSRAAYPAEGAGGGGASSSAHVRGGGYGNVSQHRDSSGADGNEDSDAPIVISAGGRPHARPPSTGPHNEQHDASHGPAASAAAPSPSSSRNRSSINNSRVRTTSTRTSTERPSLAHRAPLPSVVWGSDRIGAGSESPLAAGYRRRRCRRTTQRGAAAAVQGAP